MERQSTTFILMKIIRDLNYNTNTEVIRSFVCVELTFCCDLYLNRHENINVVLSMNVFNVQIQILIVV